MQLSSNSTDIVERHCTKSRCFKIFSRVFEGRLKGGSKGVLMVRIYIARTPGVNILQNHGKLFPDGVFSETSFSPELCVIRNIFCNQIFLLISSYSTLQINFALVKEMRS